jgi:hypothetical protein
MGEPTVLNSPWPLFTTSPPVQKSKKAPVPYVHLASPCPKHLLPTSAPCWSPTSPPIGTPFSGPSAMWPYTSEVDTSFGRMDFRKPKNSRREGSHSRERMLSSSVRDALVTSEMWSPLLTPPTRLCGTYSANVREMQWRDTYIEDPRLDGSEEQVV